MSFPSKDGPNSYVWKLKDIYNARQGDNWPTAYIASTDTGFSMGGEEDGYTNIIDYVNITSGGQALDYGDLATAATGGGVSTATRVVHAGGDPLQNVIEYFEIAVKGNTTDFGDLTVARARDPGINNNTRGLFCGGTVPGAYTNVIDYITIASTGNALDFGDMISPALGGGTNNVNSPTRGVVMGGGNPSRSDVIQYITFSSTGNMTDFGDVTPGGTLLNAGAASSTRGLYAGGNGGGGGNQIGYITIASTGNSTDFGDLTYATAEGLVGMSNSTIGLFGGGQAPNTLLNKVTIASAGNAVDYGNLTTRHSEGAASSGSHGGLS